MRSGQPPAQVAVCTLLSRDLATALAVVPGVAMTGTLATANLGVEQIVVAVTERPWIRFLVVCGKDSPLFQAGQTLVALVRNGMRAGDHRVIDARGYLPLLRNVSPEQVRAFRCQVELVDARGEQDAGRLRELVGALAAAAGGERERPGAGNGALASPGRAAGRAWAFRALRPGGRRVPLRGDPVGFFVLSVDRQAGELVLQHFRPDLVPQHEMRGRRAEPMLLGLLEAGLLDNPHHVGYLGMELAKAEVALRLDLDYEQDKPLQRRHGSPGECLAGAPTTDPSPERGESRG